MALNFPNTPTDGQVWTDPNGQSWVYETATNSWTAKGAVSGGMVYKGGIDITAAPPAAQSGWTYSITTGGTPNAGFTGLSGTLTVGTQVTFDGTKWQESGSSGPWTRTGTVLSPANAGDQVHTATGKLTVGGTAAAPNIEIKADGGIVANTDGLVYDAATKRLAIGTTSPGALLDAHGAVRLGNRSNGDGTTTISSTNGLYIGTNNDTTTTTVVPLQIGAFPAGPGYTAAPDQAIVLNGWSGGTVYHNAIVNRKGRDLSFHTAITSNTFSDTNERARIDSSGRLLVGTSSARSNFFNGTGTAALQVEGVTNDSSALSIIRNSNDIARAILTLAKTRGGSVGSTTIVQNGDEVGQISFQASDGTEFVECANIFAVVDGTPGANDMPGRLVFSTTADGASSPTEAMRISQDGQMRIAKGLSLGSSTLGIANTFSLFGSVINSGAGTNALKYHTGTGAVTYDTSSKLIKTSIVDCPYGLDEIKKLRPRKYWRLDDEKTEIGFVADEVFDVLPEFVPIGPKSIITKNDSDTESIPYSVNYDKLTAVLTKALQEAIAKIETLEAKVAALESA
jgi:hypothetical protein